MINESSVRTRTRIALYLVSITLIFVMALQNIRYGLYDIFYVSMLLLPALIFGAAYAWTQRGDLNAHIGHTAVLHFILLLVAVELLRGHTPIVHWLFGAALFSFLLQPLRQAFNFNITSLIVGTIALSYSDTFYSAVRFATSYTLLAGLAGMYAYLYHHKSRFLVEYSVKDPLTGAYNFKHLEFTLRQEISRAEITGNPLSVVALEVDYFDQQLEVHGQNVVNELIVGVGQKIQEITRAGDSAYYSSNGRFFLLLPVTPEEGLLVIAERLRRAVEVHSWPVVDSMTISIGCVTRCEGQANDEELLHQALSGLSEAQSGGHNRVVMSKQSG